MVHKYKGDRLMLVLSRRSTSLSVTSWSIVKSYLNPNLDPWIVIDDEQVEQIFIVKKFVVLPYCRRTKYLLLALLCRIDFAV